MTQVLSLQLIIANSNERYQKVHVNGIIDRSLSFSSIFADIIERSLGYMHTFANNNKAITNILKLFSAQNRFTSWMLVNRHIQAESVNILGLFYNFEGVKVCFDAELSSVIIPWRRKYLCLVVCFETKKIGILFVRCFVFDIFYCSQVHVQTCALFMYTSAQNARNRY